jgi:hypothetical protein
LLRPAPAFLPPANHPTRGTREAVIESEQGFDRALCLVAVPEIASLPKYCGVMLENTPHLEAPSTRRTNDSRAVLVSAKELKHTPDAQNPAEAGL